MSKVGHNRIQLGDDSDPNKNFVIGTPSPNDGTLEVRRGTIDEPGDLIARFTDTPLFKARNLASQGLTTGQNNKISLGVKDLDITDDFDVVNSRFSPSVPGYYFITGTIRLTATEVKANATIYKNGNPSHTGDYLAISGVGQISVSSYEYLNGSTDYLELYAYIASATGSVAAGPGGDFYGCTFSGHLVRAL